jgi:hypothetical protein
MLTIDTDPGGERVYDAHLPWQRSIAVGPGVQLLEVVAVGKTHRDRAAEYRWMARLSSSICLAATLTASSIVGPDVDWSLITDDPESAEVPVRSCLSR